MINQKALLTLHGHQPCLAEVLADVETMGTTPMPVYRGMQIYLTKNVRKADDYVNGMKCVVLAWHADIHGLEVTTRTGRRLIITRYTDRERQHAVYLPVRPGYASTIFRMQGSELPHVTVYLNMPNVQAAAYTALSRVHRAADYLIGGNVTYLHFIPASPWSIDEDSYCDDEVRG